MAFPSVVCSYLVGCNHNTLSVVKLISVVTLSVVRSNLILITTLCPLKQIISLVILQVGEERVTVALIRSVVRVKILCKM